MAALCPQAIECSEDASFRIKVLHFGHAFTHSLPYWPAISVDLRVIKYTFSDDIAYHEYHGLIKDEPSLLDHLRPFEIVVFDNPEYCFVKTEVNEFSSSVDLKSLLLLPDGILIVWKWDHQPQLVLENPDNIKSAEDNNDPSSTDAEVTHTLTFKCIGSNKEQKYQDILRSISQLPTAVGSIPVKLSPEPNNPFDARAIAFMAVLNGKEHRIGYVIRELVEEVHQSLSIIKKVQFAWVKYIIEWPHCGPGYYCGINITKAGTWSSNALKFKSTR